MRKLVLLTGLALGLATRLAVASPAYPDAKSLITAIDSKLKTVTDYSMVVFTAGEHGQYVLNYECVRPANIRTEIMEGAHRGTVIVYLPQVKNKMVKVKAGDKRMWRSIDKLKIAGSPMVQSVLDSFQTDLGAMSFTMKAHQPVTVDVGRPVSNHVNPDQDMALGDERDVPPPAPATPVQHVQHDCYMLEGSNGDTHEELAVDSKTLLPVEMKRWKGKTLEVDAQIWQINLNTSPHIDF
ncbi:MAG: hypothetical protein ACYCW6_22340 [Candidatus Xenobia bacterium]